MMVSFPRWAAYEPAIRGKARDLSQLNAAVILEFGFRMVYLLFLKGHLTGP
jgi:hypothetical protein